MYQCCPHIETSQLICSANQLAGFYMRATLAINGLKIFKNSTELNAEGCDIQNDSLESIIFN